MIKGLSGEPRLARSTSLKLSRLQREGRILVMKEKEICLDASRPAKHADAKPVQRCREVPGGENAHPRDDRRHTPGDAQYPDDDHLGDGENQAERDRESIAWTGWRVQDESGRIRSVTEWRVLVA